MHFWTVLLGTEGETCPRLLCPALVEVALEAYTLRYFRPYGSCRSSRGVARAMKWPLHKAVASLLQGQEKGWGQGKRLRRGTEEL